MNKIICILLLTISISAFGQNKMVIKKTPQKLDTVSVTGDILKISLTGDGEPAKEVTLPSGGSGGDGVTQVASVTALRATSGTSTKDVYLKSYWSGLNYGGGRFTWHSTDVTGRGDDGGISFAASGGGYWVRTEPEFRATYFGMVDTSDLAAISKTHNTREADNLTNKIPDGSKLVFDPGFVFKSYGGFVFDSYNNKTIHVEGYGSTLTRGAQIQDSIKSNSTTWVRVAHPERWDTFMYVAAYDGVDRLSFPIKITKISGDTLFCPIGSSNYATGDLFTQNFHVSFGKDNCSIRGLTVDGNIEENQLYNYWGTSGGFYLSSNNAFYNRITVKNSPGEGILLFEDNVILDGFNIQNCDGNGVHFGANATNFQVLNGIIKRVNNLARRDGIMTMGHEGGAIAHSQDVHGGMISNIQIDSALVAIADLNGYDDSLNVYDRIIASNCNNAVEFSQLSSGQTLRDLRVTNSRFYNCGTFTINSNPTGPTDSTEYVRDIVLDNVQFYNTVISLNARSFNVQLNNIYYSDTSNTDLSLVYTPHLKINGFVKDGGGRFYIAGCPRAVIENFELRETNSAISHIYAPEAGNIIIRNGAIYQKNAATGFVGIYGQIGGEISDVFIDLKGSPTYGIFSNASSSEVATTVKNCTVLTPTGVPSIRCYGGSSGGLFINNKVNNDISNIASNDDYGTINVTDDDITWGNTTTIKLLGKIRDSAGNLGTDGQVLTADASGFTVWETPSGGGGLTGSGTTNKVTKWTGASTLGNSQITDDGADVTVGEALGKITLNVGSSGSNGIDYKRGGVVEGSLNTAVYNTTYNGSMFGHNLSQAFAHINTTLNAYYMDLGGRGSSGIGGTSSGIFFGMKAASTSTETNLLTLDENGNVGIGGVTAPAQKLHVSGTARITGSDGTATTITGRDGDGDISNVSLGYGLNLVGGTLEVDTTEVATPGDLAALGGGSGDIEGVTVTSPITGGGTSGTVNIAIQQANGSQAGYLSSTDWTTFNSKYTPSGAIGYVPFFSSTTALTNQHDFITQNSGSAFKLGLGFISGGNSQLENYLTSTAASGLVIQDGTLPGLGLSTSTSNRWALMLNTSGELSFNRNTGGSWASPYITIGSAGTLKVTDLAGSGTRMAVVSADGTFSTQSIPSGAVSSVTGTNNIVASPTTGAVIITDNQISQAQLYNVGAQNYSTSSTTPVKVEGSTAIVGGSGIAASTSNENISITPSGTYRITYTINAMATATGGNTNSPIHSTQIYINGSPGANNGFCREISGSGQWVTLSRNEITLLPANAVIDLRYNHGATGSFDISLGQAYINVQRIQ